MSKVGFLISRWQTEEGKSVLENIQKLQCRDNPFLRDKLVGLLRSFQGAGLLEKAGKIDLRGASISDMQFENVAMENLDISFGRFSNCSFKNVNLNSLQSSYAQIENCTFEECTLQNFNANNSEIIQSRFMRSDFWFNFSNCKVNDVKFSFSHLRFGGANSIFQKMVIEESELIKSRTNNCHYSEVSIFNSGKIILHAPACLFERVEFSGIQFQDSVFNKSKFISSDLRNSFLGNTSVNKTRFVDCNLSGANFKDAIFNSKTPPEYESSIMDNFIHN